MSLPPAHELNFHPPLVFKWPSHVASKSYASAVAAREAILEAVGAVDELLLDAYAAEGGGVSATELVAAIRRQTLNHQFLPVFVSADLLFTIF